MGEHSETPAPPVPHPLRQRLLDLLAQRESVTATQAATVLGVSSGLCSFHLRRLAHFGWIEEVPGVPGRARPWRLRAHVGSTGDVLAVLNPELEDEAFHAWRQRRPSAPPSWRHDASFSAVVHLTAAERTQLLGAMRALVERAAQRPAATPPADAQPVAVVARAFPLLDGHDPAQP
ncbi:MAG TPA: winged helix-turn-helix domain-containing protein [Euzebyales bacterium]|nr:winged helix-turn-helix domain-containing protein [Euzebyales bacterium]